MIEDPNAFQFGKITLYDIKLMFVADRYQYPNVVQTWVADVCTCVPLGLLTPISLPTVCNTLMMVCVPIGPRTFELMYEA